MTNPYLEKTDAFMASLGVETYRVGGSVRDEFLGRRVKDADYMVRGADLGSLGALLNSALTQWAGSYSCKPLTLRDGRQAGWRVAAKGLGCMEIVLPRTEVSTGPGHGDFKLVVDENVTVDDDAVRRDFTFNALYKIIHVPSGLSTLTTAPGGVVVENVLDPTGRGLFDLSHKLVSTTYEGSFRDDPLRTLRALRFVSTLGYDLSTNTESQMRKYAQSVDGLTLSGHASGTVLDELSRILMGDDVAKALRLARDTGVLGTLLPEVSPMLHFNQESKYHDLTTCEHTFRALETAAHVGAPLRVRMALLFHDAGKPESAWKDTQGRKHYYAPSDEQWAAVQESIDTNFDVFPTVRPKPEDHEVISERLWRAVAERLNVPVPLREDVARLVRDHMVTLDGKFRQSKVRRMRVKYGDAMLHDLLLHRACDISGKERGVNPQFLQRVRAMEAARREAQEQGIPVKPTDLQVGGEDWKYLGLQGRDIGYVQRTLLDEVVTQPNEKKLMREWQIQRAASMARDIHEDQGRVT